jgi:hypothetical protein
VSAEDSGVIDLFALNERAKQAAAAKPVAPDPLSAPPPAFTSDVFGNEGRDSGAPGSASSDDDLENPFAKKPIDKRKLMFGGGAAFLLVVGLMIASFSGSGPDAPKASAAGGREAKTESTPPAPPPAPPEITPVVAPVAASPVPAPPSTGASTSSKAAPRVAGRPSGPMAKPKATTAGGVKLMKIQSAGVASK